MIADSTNTPSDVTYSLSPEKSIVIGILCRAAWQSEIYEKTAHIHLGAKLLAPDQVDTALNDALRPALEATIGGEEDETVNAISNEVAKLIGLALTRIEATGGAVIALYGTSI